MNYRFENGGLEGHSFGNLLLSALEKVTGSFEKAVDEMGKILSIKGKVIPVTTHEVRLKMLLDNRKILEGEKDIYLSQEISHGYKTIYLEPYASVNPRAVSELQNADLIVIGPGGLYTSLIPNFLVEGLSEALLQSKAKKVFVVNLMNRKGQTSGFKASDYIKEMVKFTGEDIFDFILVNSEKPPQELIKMYADEGDLVENDIMESRVIKAPFLGGLIKPSKRDLLKRNLIRHDPQRLAEELMKIVNHL
jgi:2-phospho-L-lactate transferase/gluconeogenesis factor (CofD/UPF0052 family)